MKALIVPDNESGPLGQGRRRIAWWSVRNKGGRRQPVIEICVHPTQIEEHQLTVGPQKAMDESCDKESLEKSSSMEKSV